MAAGRVASLCRGEEMEGGGRKERDGGGGGDGSLALLLEQLSSLLANC